MLLAQNIVQLFPINCRTKKKNVLGDKVVMRSLFSAAAVHKHEGAPNQTGVSITSVRDSTKPETRQRVSAPQCVRASDPLLCKLSLESSLH